MMKLKVPLRGQSVFFFRFFCIFSLFGVFFVFLGGFLLLFLARRASGRGFRRKYQNENAATSF